MALIGENQRELLLVIGALSGLIGALDKNEPHTPWVFATERPHPRRELIVGRVEPGPACGVGAAGIQLASKCLHARVVERRRAEGKGSSSRRGSPTTSGPVYLDRIGVGRIGIRLAYLNSRSRGGIIGAPDAVSGSFSKVSFAIAANDGSP